MAGIFSDGSFGDYFGETDTSPQGSYGAPGVFSYGQYNQEQAMRRMNPKDLASMQTQQMTQQKKAMEMQKMQEDRALEMQMKQAVSEASKYGPDAIASVYEQFGDAKTAMDIRKSGAGLKKLDLETAVLLQDYEKSKNSAAIGRVIQRISSLPANQRAQEWESLIPYLNQQMGSEIPEQYSPGALIGLQSIQQGIESNLQTVLSNPRTAKLAEPALRAMADPAVDKYFNDLIAAKKASLGPDLVTRANQVPMTREESQAAIADYQRRQADDGSTFQEYKKLDPETEKAKEQAQYELGQERQAQAQELSNAMAELASQENPSPAAIARVKALAESVRAGQTPLVVAANEARDAQLYRVDTSGDPDPNIDTSRTYTTKTDKDGNITYSESVKESPKTVSEKEALAKEMTSLQESVAGLDLPPSTWEDPNKNKPLSTVGKLQYDASRAKTPEERAQLEAAAAQQAKTGGGTIIQTETPDLVYAKNAVAAQEKAFQIEDSIRTIDNLMSKFDPDALTIEGKVGNAIVNFAERTKIFKGLASDEQIQKAIEGDAFMSGIDRAMVELTQGKMVGALTDRDWRNLVKGLANGTVSSGQFIQRMQDVRSEMDQSLAVAKQRASGTASGKPYTPSDSDFEKVLSIYDDPNASPDKIKKADQFIMKYGHLYK